LPELVGEIVSLLELIAFSNSINEFHELNTTVLACSVDSHLSHLKWSYIHFSQLRLRIFISPRLSMPHKDGGIRGVHIPLIADKSMTISKQYGVLDEETGVPYRFVFRIYI
jgi:alkyl hydroperoxide reductase subunit AhpC